MDRPVLHGFFRSSAAYRVRIALNLKGIEADHRSHVLRRGDQNGAEFRGINPAGLVPVFVAEDGTTAAQSVAIIEYLDEIKPEPPLLPADAAGRARVRELALDIACDVHPLNNLRVLRRLKEQFGAEEPATQEWARHWSTLGFEALETKLRTNSQTGTFCHGDQPGLADICLVPQAGKAIGFGVELTSFPTISRIVGECAALLAFDKARPELQPDAE